MTLPKELFYLIQHGQTEYNQRHLVTGYQDIPLNAQSIQKFPPITYIISSPLKRTMDTAKTIAFEKLKHIRWSLSEGQPIEQESSQ